MTTGGPAYTKGRPDGPPIWVVVHDMEFPERPDAAEWTAAYFARGADGRSVSSHYTADHDSIVQCVRLADTAWTVGNRAGNYRGINWELAGYASQTREQWLDPYSRAMLERVAVIMRRDMARFAIPARLLTDEQARSRTPGVTSHAQLGRAFGGTDHTDPGRNFPWDVLIQLLTGDEMPTVAEIWGQPVGLGPLVWGPDYPPLVDPDGNVSIPAEKDMRAGVALAYAQRYASLAARQAAAALREVKAARATIEAQGATLAAILARLDTSPGGGVSETQVRAAVGDALEAGAAAARQP